MPEADPRLLTRATLGLYNSIWHWYRPRGTLTVDDIADFFIRRQLAVLGLSPDLLDRGTQPRRPRATLRASASLLLPRSKLTQG